MAVSDASMCFLAFSHQHKLLLPTCIRGEGLKVVGKKFAATGYRTCNLQITGQMLPVELPGRPTW